MGNKNEIKIIFRLLSERTEEYDKLYFHEINRNQ